MMGHEAFGLHPALVRATRLPAINSSTRISIFEITTLFLAGAAAATITGFVRLELRIPGNVIILAVLPMALGLALVPRRLGGIVMSGGALATATVFSAARLTHYGTGNLTSMFVAGPMMDVALIGAALGWRLYLRFLAAGIAANLIAFLQRSTSKLFALDPPGTRLFAEWVAQGIVTYTICGALAGLLAASCWFQLRSAPPGARR